jgi:hypothetical protein
VIQYLYHSEHAQNKKKAIMIQKKKVIETLKGLPDNFPIDDQVERLIIINKIEKAQENIPQAETHLIPAGGRMLIFERYNVVNALIRDFMTDSHFRR